MQYGLGFCKVVKNRSYFKRYQVRFRRRRQGVTNYRKRTKLISQDKTQFNVPKYRFVVRISNRFVTCQVVWAKVVGDEVLCSSHSSELSRYGLTVGLKNYSAVYCTAYLCGRRLLKQFELDQKYEGVDEISGEQYLVVPEEDIEGSRPFKCYLDIGLARATIGAKVFAALKGACDAGLFIPHRVRKFPGYDADTKEYDPEVHRQRILGQHLVEYMKQVRAADIERYNRQFSKFVEAGIDPDDYPDLIQGCIEKIRADPSRPAKRERVQVGPNRYDVNRKKLPLAVRKQRIAFKKQKMLRRRERYLQSL